jgi:branched-chain amino acid aminotransferase
MVVFLNGEFLPGDQAHIGVMTHGFSYGTGCFEGIRGYWNPKTQEVYLFRLREHFERLHRSCRIMNIKLPHPVDDLMDLARELIARNGFRENCYIRPFAYKADEVIGVKLHDLTDHFTMIASAMGDYVATTGLHCGVSSWRRIDDNMIPARAKVSGAYVNSALAKTEALKSGFDEAIMLTSEGHVSEGSAENIFLVVGNELITPPPSENILLGVTRDTVMQLALRDLGRITRERVIDRTELYVADEIFLCGTGAQIAPVVKVDHRPVGTGTIGPIAGEIQHLYAEVVRGMRPEYMDWCTPVYATERVKMPDQAVTETVAASAASTMSTANSHTATVARANGNGHNGTGRNATSRTRKRQPAVPAGRE